MELRDIMPVWLRWITLFLVILVLYGSLIGYAHWYAGQMELAFESAACSMPQDGRFTMTYLENGLVHIVWPESEDAQAYFLEFRRDNGAGEQETFYSTRVDEGHELFLPAPLDRELTVRIMGLRYYRYPFRDVPYLRFSENYIELSGDFAPPTVSDLTWSADPDTDQVVVDFAAGENTVVRMYYRKPNGVLVPLEELTQTKLTMTFGDNERFRVPPHGQSHSFVFDAVTTTDTYTYTGVISNGFTVVREDFLGTELFLECKDEGHNDYTLTWNETKGDYYEVQLYSLEEGRWNTVHTVPFDGERSYYTGHLERYSDFLFRVVAYGSQTLPDSEFSATPDEVMVKTGASLIYSTIWPIKNLEVFAAPGANTVVGKLPEGTPCCVLDEKDGMFYIRFSGGYGYIDSNYCMINLPEYIGDICMYDIVNSYESLYKVHEFPIPEVTGEVVKGYEDVELWEGEYLVPLLYPTAQKLEKAAFAAIEKGYKIKIYDSYRPKDATEDIYDIAEKILEDKIPDEIYCSEEDRRELIWYDMEDILLWYNVLKEDLEIPEELIPVKGEGEETPPEETEPADPPTEPADPDEKKTLEDYRPTYEELMTDNGRYSLAYFLAQGGSRHNQGIAMDLTLFNLYTWEEVEMQTAIHDLSWYSEIRENNYSAWMLREIMFDAGFAGLVSEWWHFQDDESLVALDLPFMRGGVSPRCWMADDNGWRFRTVYGWYLYDCEDYIDGVLYRFDSDGYATRVPTENTDPET